MARKVIVNVGKTQKLALIKVSEKQFLEPSTKTPIPNAKIDGVQVIIDGEVKPISTNDFWKYDSIVNVLGDDD